MNDIDMQYTIVHVHLLKMVIKHDIISAYFSHSPFAYNTNAVTPEFSLSAREPDRKQKHAESSQVHKHAGSNGILHICDYPICEDERPSCILVR